MATDAGYGFVARLEDLHGKNRNGKSVISVPKGARVMQPIILPRVEALYLASVSNEGRMLVFPVSELPELARGKGNKIISIPGARVQNREEFMVAVALFSPQDQLAIQAGKRQMKLQFSDLEHYLGERGRRGHKLPRGLQRVDAIEVIRQQPAGDVEEGNDERE